jgi:hypothetical protein
MMLLKMTIPRVNFEIEKEAFKTHNNSSRFPTIAFTACCIAGSSLPMCDFAINFLLILMWPLLVRLDKCL